MYLFGAFRKTPLKCNYFSTPSLQEKTQTSNLHYFNTYSFLGSQQKKQVLLFPEWKIWNF